MAGTGSDFIKKAWAGISQIGKKVVGGGLAGQLLTKGGRSGLNKALLGTDAQSFSQPILQPDQVKAQQEMMKRVMSSLGPAYDYEPFKAQMIKDFNQRTVPGLARPYSSVGEGSARNFGAFYTDLAQARGALDTNLGLLKPQFAQRQIQQLLPYLFQQRSQNQTIPGQPGALQGFAQSGLPALIGSAFGPFGAAAGSAAGSAVGSLFQNRNNAQGQNQGLQQLPSVSSGQGGPPQGGPGSQFGSGGQDIPYLSNKIYPNF